MNSGEKHSKERKAAATGLCPQEGLRCRQCSDWNRCTKHFISDRLRSPVVGSCILHKLCSFNHLLQAVCWPQ